MISLILPTRERVSRLTEFLNSVLATVSDSKHIEVILYVDDDDLDTANFDYPHKQLCIKKIILPHNTMGFCNTECYRHASYNIIMLVNDDIIIRTKNWDKIIIDTVARFSDDIYLMYPNDLFKGKKLAAFPILSRRYCELVGSPFPEIYKGAFIDSEIFEIFHRLKYLGDNRIVYLENVIFEHMHYRLKKSVFDMTYRKRDRFGDDWAFICLRNHRQAVAKLLYDYIHMQHVIPYQLNVALLNNMPPKSFFSKANLCFKVFFLDTELPFFSRIWLFLYHVGRDIYERGKKKYL